ncbi:hypothetical protein C2E21_6789 [Chlorella sorokiniana]|uniref:Uncharacterized protein n=1 Tax=Chlorella sorokiniana TaxID=3076 RepID=A0A2P6TKB5_CHLSO|nr:hypothetical protein C2E21_6789 [Chlorella sorokiniana]|eukprot:PRW44532.1 hypothetical protein C2E21_6789 [Chlorella sorokiniana]
MAAPKAPDLKQQLYELLSGAGSPATAWSRPLACSAGPLTRISPGLHVAGSSALKLPLQAEQAEAIKAAAGGDGGGSSGGVWVLPAAQLEVTNPRWESEVVAEAVRRTRAVLGLHDTRVEARLSRLELHEAGSTVEGGQLRVLHNGREEQVDLASRNAKSSCFAAYFSGCRVGMQPLTAGHRCLLFYDLVWAGGSRPPQPPLERAAGLVELSQQWNAAADAPMRFCFMLNNRYGETELRERGIEALQGGDKAAAQMLLAACQQGAELDVCFTLVKATARPQMDRYEIFQDVCEVYGLHPCAGCGEIHFEDAAMKEEDIWDIVYDILKSVVFDNEPASEEATLHWKHVMAAKFVALAGSSPLEPLLALQTSELLHDAQYFAGPPDRGMVQKDVDYLHSLHATWLQDGSQGAFAGLPPDSCPGFDTLAPAVDQGALPDSPWELAEAIGAYLAEQPAPYFQGKSNCLFALLELAASPQLTAHRPPGEVRLVASLLAAARTALATTTLTSFSDRLTTAVIRLLRCYQWPANALGALQAWVHPTDAAVKSGMAILEARLADAGDSAQHTASAWVAASALALSLAKGLRLGCVPDKLYYMSWVFSEAHKPLLLLLHRVATTAGCMALEAAVEAVLAHFFFEPPTVYTRLYYSTLRTACVALLEELPPHIVAGCPALLKLICSCAANVHAALEASIPVEPQDWSKQLAIQFAEHCQYCQQLQEFVGKADQQACTLPCGYHLDIIVRVYIESAWRNPPKWRDLDAERVQLEGGADGWRFTKSHKAYQQEVAEHAEQRQKLDALLQLLLPCLVLALPCDGSSSCWSVGAAAGEGPPAKAPRFV